MVITRRMRILAAATAMVLAGFAALGLRWWDRDPKDVLFASGIIESSQVDVSFKIPGRVIQRPVDEGDRLEAGALVGRLESRELEAEA